MDYTEVEDYDCPRCEWSLHVEKRVWNDMEDHSLVLAYIQSQVSKHNKTHGVDKETIQLYKQSPYTYYSDTSNSLVVLRDDIEDN